MKIGTTLLGITLLIGSSVASSFPTYIDATGREWLDPNVTRAQKWFDVAAVCSVADGSCNGQLQYSYFNGGTADPAGLDLTGYVWATRDEVRDLFYELGGLPSGSLDDYSASFDRADGYGANVFSKVDSTLATPFESILNGFTRTVDYDSSAGLVAYLGTIFGPGLDPYFNMIGIDSFNLTTAPSLQSGTGVFAYGDMSLGAFLYKPSALPVPLPGPLALAVVGGLALAMRGWRKRRDAAQRELAQ